MTKRYETAKYTANSMSRSCLGKARWTEAKALKKAKEWDQRPYYCLLCNGWHLTKNKELKFENK